MDSKEGKNMHLINNNKGLTYIELLIAVSLLTVVLMSAYYFLSFSRRSMVNTQVAFEVGNEARNSIMQMESQIRTAKSTIIDSTYHNAVEIPDSEGMQLNIYTNIDDDEELELIQYKLDGKRLVMGKAEVGNSPTQWYTIVNNVKNKMFSVPKPIFTIEGSRVTINLYVYDEAEQLLDEPVQVKASYTVRSKGAMD